jgi:predicted RND superfamily exporter protein
MQLLTLVLRQIFRFSFAFPRIVIAIFLVLAVAGFSSMPFITVSSNLLAGVGQTNPVINLGRENSEIFGEQDSLIVVIEFPEPPGEDRLQFIKGLGDCIAQISGVRRVRYQFIDPENSEEVAHLFKNFLLGMNQREQDRIKNIFSTKGIGEALRRNRNRLFLTEHPFLQKQILEDPLELGQFVSDSMKKRVGAVSLGDIYLLVASPDSTVYLIQVTPSFPSTDIVRGKALMDRMLQTIPVKTSELMEAMPNLREKSKDLKWHLTGKTAFHYESDQIFERETTIILLFSFSMVMLLLVGVYRSLWSAVILMTPIAAGIGPNYALIYLGYDEVNPVVMGATGVLFGLATDYGVHLWGRFTEEIDKGTLPADAVAQVYELTGPPVMLGALTTILAFLCLCFSHQPAMAQFGYVGASGLALSLVSTLFLFPALVAVTASRQKDYFPRMQVDFSRLSGLFNNHPGTITIVSAVILVNSLFLASRVSYEKDLFKVFFARNMDSIAVSNTISKKFHVNFSQPTLLSFDIENFQEGLEIQSKLDDILENLMGRDREIASVDSISYLVAPDSVRTKNMKLASDILEAWPRLKDFFTKKLEHSDLSNNAAQTMDRSFDSVAKILGELQTQGQQDPDSSDELERSWYTCQVMGKYRFLTQIRFSAEVADPDKLKKVDRKIMDAVKTLPVSVGLSGPRQSMEEILSTLVSELVRLGLYVLFTVILFFVAFFRHPVGVVLSLIPMVGAFCVTLGVMGALGMGLPFSVVGVAPLIFGLGMDNGVHVVMGSSPEEGGSVSKAMARVTRPIIFSSLTNVMGFVPMLTSKHYAMEFLAWAMVIGMTSAVAFTLTTLPALLLLLERRRNIKIGEIQSERTP